VLAHLVSLVLQPPQLPRRVGEEGRVELKVAPLEATHPEAVVVEHADGDVAFAHAVQERVDRLLVVIRREGRRQPAAGA
jgi:hypothetical protein